MDPKRTASYSRRLNPLAPIKYKPEIPIPVGVIKKCGGFWCLICDREFTTLQGSVSHSKGRQHLNTFAVVRNNCQRSARHITCKFCPEYTTTNWNSLLLHFYLENHFHKLKVNQTKPLDRNPQGFSVSYVTLKRNQIIEPHPGTYFCCRCGKFMMDGWVTVVDHIEEERHKEFQQTHQIDDCDGNIAEYEFPELVKNYVSHVSYSNYYCYLCDRSITGQKNCLIHIKGFDHTQNIANKRDINYLPLYVKVKTIKKSVQKITEPVQKLQPKSLAKVLQENCVIGPSATGTYYCKLCGCTCFALPHLNQHILGKRHKNCMEQVCKDPSSSSESKGTESSSSSCESTKNSSDSWEAYECVSEGYKFSENPSDSWETFDTRSLDSWETISIRSSLSELRGPRPLEIPKNLVPLISKHLLQHREKEIYCPACKAHIKDPQNLVSHVVSRQHIAELSSYKAKVSQKPEDRADTSGKNRTSAIRGLTSEKKSPVPINLKTEVSTTVQKMATNRSALPEQKLIHIPANLSPLLKSHFLTQTDYEVSCPACNVRLRHINKVLEHINSRNHEEMLNVYKNKIARKPDSTRKTLRMHTAVNTPTTHTGNKIPMPRKSEDSVTASTSSTTTPLVPDSRLMDIPQKLVPLIAMHSLKHLKDQIYCPACDIQMKHSTSLVSHTRSPRHTANLKLFRMRDASKNMNTQKAPHLGVAEARRDLNLGRETDINRIEPNQRSNSRLSDNIVGLERSVNELTIAEVKKEDVIGSKGNEVQQDAMKINKKLQRSQNFKKEQLKRKKPPTQKNKRINGRSFDPKYLKVEMQYIYEVNPEKMRIMKLSCQLCFPKTSIEIYCLICEQSVAGESQKFYEHICSPAHTQYLAAAERDDKQFIPYPEQFSDLSLAKEFLQETVEETIQCLACDMIVENDDAIISEHIKQDSHTEGKLVWNVAMEKILQDILAKTESTWYNIQKYWCQPCDMQYNTEFQFAEHMDTKRHNDSLKKIGTFRNRLVYDACIPCAMLWLGFSGLYTQHCDQPMHKYLLQTGDYSVCILPGQVKTLLETSEVAVEKLIKLSDQVSTVQKVKADALLKCLEDTVKPKFPHAKAHPFGSRVSGLGFPDSDIDVFLDCGTYNGTKNIEDFEIEIIMSVEDCLCTNQQSWEIEETLTSSRTPIIKLRHRSTELSCDVSFKNGLSVENTKLLKCFMDNYPLCRKLMLFIKKWLHLCNLSGSQYITNYAICWYVIFYLQSKSILPSVASLIAKENKSNIIDGWETGISETFDECQEKFTFTELLSGFFEFYTNFDYRYSVACPILGSAIPKQDFTELLLLPKEMAPYVNRIKTKGFNGPVELFRIDSEMCIQDPYDLSHNLTKAVRKFTLNRFKRLCAASADVLNNCKQH